MVLQIAYYYLNDKLLINKSVSDQERCRIDELRKSENTKKPLMTIYTSLTIIKCNFDRKTRLVSTTVLFRLMSK